ncbi:hypothetical protein CK203_072622 [Vitis vinifera]|uniref:Uncharacterized protein n=1 Tax=Vitis vinifera TaxID=29760 RepID=A0A438EZ84_VITVI|nr:hypothetical protein CK203_072622 [Vitis vinifera]
MASESRLRSKLDTMKATFLILLVGIVTTKTNLGQVCENSLVDLCACAVISYLKNLGPNGLSPACYESLIQIQALEANLGTNVTCLCT